MCWKKFAIIDNFWGRRISFLRQICRPRRKGGKEGEGKIVAKGMIGSWNYPWGPKETLCISHWLSQSGSSLIIHMSYIENWIWWGSFNYLFIPQLIFCRGSHGNVTRNLAIQDLGLACFESRQFLFVFFYCCQCLGHQELQIMRDLWLDCFEYSVLPWDVCDMKVHENYQNDDD